MGDEEPEGEHKSRSQLKREFAELKAFGAELVALKKKRLEALPLMESTLDAILAGQAMGRSPLQRQLRRIAALLENEDIEALRAALEAPPESATVEFETWRDDLIAGDDELLMEFVDHHPEVDRQHLRQLLLNARKDGTPERRSKASAQVLDYIQRFAAKPTD